MASDLHGIVGRLAVEKGLLTSEQLADCLVAQKMSPGKSFTDIIVSKGLATADAVRGLNEEAAARASQNSEAPATSVKKIGPYELGEKLGDSGPVEVHTAVESATGSLVELRVLPDSAPASEIVQRFTPLRDKIVGFEHVNVVKCMAFERDDAAGCHYWAVEHIDGESIRDRTLRLGSLSEKEVVGIGNHLSATLVQLFGRGIVHLGIQPSSIVLDSAGYAKLTGTGFSDLRTDGDGLRYASPEHASGSLNIDVRADVYALGASLHFMATGKVPFADVPLQKVPGAITNGALPWPSDANPKISPRVSRVIAKMMAIDPDERYKTPTELNLDFGIIAGGQEPVIALNTPSRSVIDMGAGLAASAAADEQLPQLAPEPPPARSTTKTKPLPDAPARPPSARLARPAVDVQYDDVPGAPAGGGNTRLLAAVGGGVAAAAIGLVLMMLGGGRAPEKLPEVKLQVATPDPDMAAESARRERAGENGDRAEVGAKEALEAAVLFLAENPDQYSRALSKLELARDLAKGTPLLPGVAKKIAEVNSRWDEAAKDALDRARGYGKELIARRDIDGAFAAVEDIDQNLSGRVSAGIVQLASEVLARGNALVEQEFTDAEAKIASGEYGAARVILEGLDRIKFERQKSAIDKRRQELLGRMTTVQAKQAEDQHAKTDAAFVALLDRFDALVEGGDLGAARDLMTSSATKPEFEAVSETLRSAAAVAQALAGRQKAMVSAVAAMKGQPLTVTTASGVRKGTVASADGSGIVLVAKVIINGQVRGETKHSISWTDLSPDAVQRFTSSWVPAGPEGAIAQAIAAAKDGRIDDAKRAVALAGSSPLAKRCASQVARLASAAVERAAADAWNVIEKRAALPRLSVPDGKRLVETIAVFEKDHGGTAFAKSHAAQIAKAKARARAAAAPESVAAQQKPAIAPGTSGPGAVTALLKGTWTPAKWANPATSSYSAARRRLGLTINVPRGGRLDKSAVGRKCSINLSEASTIGFHARNEGRTSVDVAIGLFTAEAGYFESRTVSIQPRRAQAMVVDLKSREFRNGRTQWRFGASITGLQTVTEVFLIVYNRRAAATVRVDRLQSQ